MENTKELYMNTAGHLNIEGIAYYVNHLLEDNNDAFPTILFDHVRECLICKTEVVELHETMKEKQTISPLTISKEVASIETLLAKISQDVAFQEQIKERIYTQTPPNSYLVEKMNEQLVVRNIPTPQLVRPDKNQLCIGQVHFVFKEQLTSDTTLNIIDAMGKETEYICPSNRLEFTLEMENASSGLYYYLLYDEGNILMNPFYFCTTEEALVAYQEYLEKN